MGKRAGFYLLSLSWLSRAFYRICVTLSKRKISVNTHTTIHWISAGYKKKKKPQCPCFSFWQNMCWEKRLANRVLLRLFWQVSFSRFHASEFWPSCISLKFCYWNSNRFKDTNVAATKISKRSHLYSKVCVCKAMLKIIWGYINHAKKIWLLITTNLARTKSNLTILSIVDRAWIS